jgi:hypothetical protein
LAAVTLMGILTISTSTVKAGILMTDDLKSETTQPCVETKDTSTKVDSGILVTFTGILVTFTGILVTFSDNTQTDCGILVTAK